jgi:hypothetical protein
LADYRLIEEYFSTDKYELQIERTSPKRLNPMSLRFVKIPPSVDDEEFGDRPKGHRQIMWDVVGDFVDDLLSFIPRKSLKGAAICTECGQMYSRSFYGREQKYCSRQCKKRANQRDYREKRIIGTLLGKKR